MHLYCDNHVSHVFLAGRLNTIDWYDGRGVTMMRNPSHNIMANSPSYSMMGNPVHDQGYQARPLVYMIVPNYSLDT